MSPKKRRESGSSAAVATDDEEAATPSPAKKAKGQKWFDPICTTATVVTGGRSNRYHVVETKEIQSANGVVRKFIRASKNDDWVLKIVLGDTAFRGGLKRTTLVEELKKTLCRTFRIRPCGG